MPPVAPPCKVPVMNVAEPVPGERIEGMRTVSVWDNHVNQSSRVRISRSELTRWAGLLGRLNAKDADSIEQKLTLEAQS